MKKQSILISTIIVIIIVLSVVEVGVSNSLSTTGVVLSGLEQDVSFYKKENLVLKQKLLLTSSLTQVASKAAELGFVKEKSQFFVSTSLPVASKP